MRKRTKWGLFTMQRREVPGISKLKPTEAKWRKTTQLVFPRSQVSRGGRGSAQVDTDGLWNCTLVRTTAHSRRQWGEQTGICSHSAFQNVSFYFRLATVNFFGKEFHSFLTSNIWERWMNLLHHGCWWFGWGRWEMRDSVGRRELARDKARYPTVEDERVSPHSLLTGRLGYYKRQVTVKNLSRV